MFKIFIASIAIAMTMVNSLEALSLRKEFYARENLPKQYENLCEGADSTFLFSKGWPSTSRISITEQSILTHKGKKKLPPLDLVDGSFMYVVSSIGYIPGCPVTLTFRDSRRSGLKQETTLIPYRLYAESNVDKAQVEATMVGINPTFYRISFTGFNEQEEVFFKSQSYGEKIENHFQVSEMALGVTPDVTGKEGGIAHLSFTRPSGEVLKLDLSWGYELLKYLYYEEDKKPKSLIEDEEFLKDNPDIAAYFRSERE